MYKKATGNTTPTIPTISDRTNRRSPYAGRTVQNFRVVWLDANIDESNKDFRKSLKYLRRVIASVEPFTNAAECIQYMKEIHGQQIFMIVSGSLGQSVVPKLHSIPQLVSVYVFCRDIAYHKGWSKMQLKVKGVFDDIREISKALENDGKRCDQTMIGISFNGIDPFFMYTQLLKEALLQVEEDDAQAIKEFVEYCRSGNEFPENKIELVEKHYNSYDPIWWYTGDNFIHTLLNRGLRTFDVDIILKMGFFIRHLHQSIVKHYNEQQKSSTSIMAKQHEFSVFRGQALSEKDFEKLKQAKGGLMSFNNFLSTTRKQDVAITSFVRPALKNFGEVGILFVMKIDPQLCAKSNIPFVEVKDNLGYFGDQEAEVLFSAHTVFRIEKIDHIPGENLEKLFQVNLTLISPDNHELSHLIESKRKEIGERKGLSRLALMLREAGKIDEAATFYHALLKRASSNEDVREYCNQLGSVYDSKGDYAKAISYYERSLEIQRNTLHLNPLELAATYNSIANVYAKKKDYSQALAFYEHSLEIVNSSLPTKHPDLATALCNIGNVYLSTGDYWKALAYHQRSFEIRKTSLPDNHPHLGASYNNIGSVYDKMGEYSKALSYFEQSLVIKQKSLPPEHPDIKLAKRNIETVKKKL